MSELKVALTDVPKNLNPYESNTLHIHTVMWPIYEPLFDIRGGLYPRLAEDWGTRDGRTYVFQLRGGVTFYPSKAKAPFTARAVVESLQQVRSKTSFRERILSDLIEIDDIKDDGNTVRIPLKYPKPELLFLALMTRPHDDKDKPPVGTGPFYLDNVNNDGFFLAKNPEYRPEPKLGQIIFKVSSPAPAELINQLNTADFHFVRDVDPETVLDVLDQPQLRTCRVRPFGLHYLGFNLDSKLFGKREVRRAFRESIDFEDIEAETGLEPAKGPIPAGVEAYDPMLSTPGQHRAVSRRALQEACRGSKITLLFNDNSYYGHELADLIEQDLVESKVVVTRKPKLSSSDLLAEIAQRRRSKEDDPYVFIYNWYSILPAAEIFLRPLFEKGMPDNLTGYTDVDDLLEATREPNIPAKVRIQRYRDAQRKIVDDAPAIFLGHSRVRYSVYREGVTGLALNVQSFPVDRYLGVDVR